MKKWRTLVLCYAALLWGVVLPGPACAQDDGVFQAIVVDSQGARLPRITILLRDSRGGEMRAVSDNNGRIFVADLTLGPYEAVVEGQGFAPYRMTFAVAAGQPEEDEAKLPRIELRYPVPDFEPVDRWRMRLPPWQRYPEQFESPFVRNRGADPYDQNRLKGDLPISGENLFLNLSFVSETPFEYRRLPTPSGVSAERPGSEQFFGQPQQYATSPTLSASIELFHGSTAFRPRDWALRVTPVFNLNYVNTRERNVLDISPEEGPNRRRTFLALQEAFGEVKLADVGANYDFVSVRGGIQPFNSDFRGFLFRDTNLGARAFGTWGRNRNQWNAAVFDQLEKETNSDLNLRSRRMQRVLVGNYYRQDFLTPGYTISPSVHVNIDDGEDFFFDENGFLVRPSPVGEIRVHSVRAYYAGIGGDGHWGRLNVTHQFYQAFGTDEFNGIAGRETDINAHFAAAEVSVDRDWWRPKASILWASGDAAPDDDTARGFDAILDNPNFAGSPFSFWGRQGIRLSSTGVALKGRSSLLPTLRSSKTEGQASFVNPGLLLINGGMDAELTTKLRISGNVSYLRFDTIESLQRILFQSTVEKSIGIDSSVAAQYRPALNENLVLTGGMAVFMPGNGFKNILTNGTLYSPFVAVTLAY